MRIGLSFDAKEDGIAPPGAPDDWQEEFDSPATLKALQEALQGLGHDVTLLGNGPALVRSFSKNARILSLMSQKVAAPAVAVNPVFQRCAKR